MQCWINIKRIQKEQTSVKLGSHKIFYETHFTISSANYPHQHIKETFLFPFKTLFSGVPDYFDRNKISSGGDLSHYTSASLY